MTDARQLLLHQRDDFLNAPYMVCDSSFHRWRHAQRLMHAAREGITNLCNGADVTRWQLIARSIGRTMRCVPVGVIASE